VGHRVGLDGCGKSRPPLGFDPRTVQAQRVAIPTELPRPTVLYICMYKMGARGGVVVKVLRYKPAGRGFDSRWCHWNFSVT
jgi:hypothetical protein